MKSITIDDIKTDLFQQVTICDYGNCKGVRLLSFDERGFSISGLPEDCKHWYITEVNMMNDKINISYHGRVANLSHEQIDEIQRISKLIREEK